MNSTLNNKKFGKIMLIISIVSLLWISTLGLVYHMNGMKFEGAKNSCLLGSENNGCAMNFSEHVTVWNEMFTLMPQNILNTTSSLVSFVLLFVIFVFARNYLSLYSRQIYLKFKLYIKEHPQINLFNYLGEIFSSGILNTKKYKLANI
ncbi:MAG: hypothetical protein WCW54_01130 [Candidatus Paceibacterota bacterium]